MAVMIQQPKWETVEVFFWRKLDGFRGQMQLWSLGKNKSKNFPQKKKTEGEISDGKLML